MATAEIVARVERRRKWTAAEKAALLAELQAEGGKVAVVARRHRISESLLYSWRSALNAAVGPARAPEPVDFVPIGVLGHADHQAPAILPSVSAKTHVSAEDRTGMIEIDLPSGACIRVDAGVNEKALRRVLQAMKGAV